MQVSVVADTLCSNESVMKIQCCGIPVLNEIPDVFVLRRFFVAGSTDARFEIQAG